MKAVQKFSAEYLEYCKKLKPHEIIQFVEDFRTLHGNNINQKSKLISLKVAEPLLRTFRAKAAAEGIAYQTKIKALMEEWVKK